MRSIRTAVVIGFAILVGIGQIRAARFRFDSALAKCQTCRGGRTRAVCGVPSQPNVFYMAAVNGGVFKSIDYGCTWQPIFDDQPTASIGAIAVAPSNSNVVYVGSGEGLHGPDLSVGDGVYKSTDTEKHGRISDCAMVSRSAIGGRYHEESGPSLRGRGRSSVGPNEERGVYRSVDSGKTFKKVLSRDENVGASNVQIDPSNPAIVYAALWESREGPWENGVFNGNGGGIFKSVDGGDTWRQLTSGLPDKIVQANLAIAPSTQNTTSPQSKRRRSRKFIVQMTAAKRGTARLMIRAPVLELVVEICQWCDSIRKIPRSFTRRALFVGNRQTAEAWHGWRGAPGGDDYQNIWINPNNPDIILLGADQGAIITVNGGKTWSSWYNQPTAQLYHVSADNSFPYRLYSGQQESGSVGIKSRGDEGEITFRDWKPVAAEEYGYELPIRSIRTSLLEAN